MSRLVSWCTGLRMRVLTPLMSWSAKRFLSFYPFTSPSLFTTLTVSVCVCVCVDTHSIFRRISAVQLWFTMLNMAVLCHMWISKDVDWIFLIANSSYKFVFKFILIYFFPQLLISTIIYFSLQHSIRYSRIKRCASSCMQVWKHTCVLNACTLHTHTHRTRAHTHTHTHFIYSNLMCVFLYFMVWMTCL